MLNGQLRLSKVMYFLVTKWKSVICKQSTQDKLSLYQLDGFTQVLHARYCILLTKTVYTPEDSLVFGGNFLHGYNVKQQLRVYDIENVTGVAIKFRFPLYEQMQWYAATKYLDLLKGTYVLICSFQ